MVRQAPVICVMAPPIHLGVWSMALIISIERARVCAVMAQEGELDGVTAVVELNTMPEVEDHPYT